MLPTAKAQGESPIPATIPTSQEGLLAITLITREELPQVQYKPVGQTRFTLSNEISIAVSAEFPD
jgi:hypothetical protein